MLDLMIEECQISNFALVNVHHSDSSFAKLCEYVTESLRLRELNLSWQCLRPSVFFQFLRVIRDNRFLVNLTIAWNKLIEDQPAALTERQIEKGLTEVPLSAKNTEILDCLAQFIKYNTYLVHLDVSNCGLNEPALKFLASFLTKSQALQCLHLDNNEGVS